MMFKKKGVQHLEPIKVNKSEANYQMLLLQMMKTLVGEQRESNRLLKKLVGEEEKRQRLPSINAQTPQIEKKVTDGNRSQNRGTFSQPYESSENQHQTSDRGLISEQSSNYGGSSNKNIMFDPKMGVEFFNPLSEELSKKIDGLGSVLQKIDDHLVLNSREREKDRQRQIQREWIRQKDRERDLERERERDRQIERLREFQIKIQREMENQREKEREKEKESPKPRNTRPASIIRRKEEVKKEEERPDQGEQSRMLESQTFKSRGPKANPSADKKKKDDTKKGEESEDPEFTILEAENITKKKIDINKFRKSRIQWNNASMKTSVTTDPLTDKNVKIVDSLLRLGEQNSEGRADLEREVQNKRNYSMVSQILPYSDRREIKIRFSVEDIYNYYRSKGETIEISKIAEEWLGLVYRATASICWNMLSNHLLNFEETKILFTQNIIFNFIEFMKSTQGLGFGSLRVSLVQDINSTAVNILDFLCTQYPQTKVEDPNIALRAEIPSIDNKGQVKYDFIGRACKSKTVKMRKRKNGDYTPEIMKIINDMIDKSNEQFEDFSSTMTELFEEIFLPLKKRRMPDKPEQSNQLQSYYQKVKTYTKFVIGRKISKNTPKYSKPEIDNGVFFVKSTSILRLITKWVEELDEIVRHPERQIKNSNKEFKDDDGLPIHLYAQVKNGVFRAIKENQENFYEKIRNIKRECYNMEVLLTMTKFITDPEQLHLSDEQISVGKYCSYLKSAIASYICSQLNQLIDFLLDIPYIVDQTKIGISDQLFQEQSRKDLDNLNLIGFKIFDLLRCKCTSKESQIIYLMRRLTEKSNDPKDPFHIVRVKDRLGTGTRDILINAQIDKGLVCQIQLAVVSGMEKKQELLDQYNHFLYELKRAKLGSITESASIWSALEQRAKFFEERIERVEKVCDGKGPHPCVTDNKKPNFARMNDFQRPILCMSCNNFFEIPRTCLMNIKCEECGNTFCGECHYQHLREEQRKDFVFEKLFFKSLFPFIKQYSDYTQPFPRYGFLVRKLYLKKELFFYRVITKRNQDAENTEQVSLELVYSGIENGQFFNKIINKNELLASIKNDEIFLEESSQAILKDAIIFEISKLGKGAEKMTIPYKDMRDHFDKSKIRFVNLMKHPVYVEDIKLFKKPKVIEKEINSLKNILEEDTLITYLKVGRTVFILQVEVQEDVLQKELIKLININRLRNYAYDKCNSVSMEFREVTDEMDMIEGKFPPELMESFSQRLSKLYLNFGYIEKLTFLGLFPNLKVLYIRNNRLASLEGVECLLNLGVICFDNNSVSSLEPLTELVNLTQISGTSNQLSSLKGIQKLKKLKKCSLFKNLIKQMEFFDALPKIHELSLAHNPIEKIDSIFHLKDLIQLNLGKTSISDLQPLRNFRAVKKLTLNGLNMKTVGPIFREFEELLKLNLADNQIEKMQNFDELTQLIELSLRDNRIKRIEGLTNCVKLETLRMSGNLITDVNGIKSLEYLKTLKLLNNPLNDCTELHLMSRKHFKLIFSKTGEAESPDKQPTPDFYQKYNAIIQHRISSSGSGSSSSDSD